MKFPHLVQMQRQYAQDGLVCMSLSVDPPEDKDNALAFLKEKGATFQNFMLVDTDENHEKWKDDFPATGPPIVHVFDRSGKKVKTFDGKFSEEDVENLVKKLLTQK